MGLELVGGRLPARASIEEARKAAVHVADRIAAENPGVNLTDPRLTAGVLELLAALGIRPDDIRRRT